MALEVMGWKSSRSILLLRAVEWFEVWVNIELRDSAAKRGAATQMACCCRASRLESGALRLAAAGRLQAAWGAAVGFRLRVHTGCAATPSQVYFRTKVPVFPHDLGSWLFCGPWHVESKTSAVAQPQASAGSSSSSVPSPGSCHSSEGSACPRPALTSVEVAVSRDTSSGTSCAPSTAAPSKVAVSAFKMSFSRCEYDPLDDGGRVRHERHATQRACDGYS